MDLGPKPPKGYSYRAPLRGSGGKPRNRHFTFDSLYRLLSNPSYIGVRQIRAKDKATQSTQAVWPAMIDVKTFEKAQALLEAGRRQKTGHESRYPYLLSTRIICGQCQAEQPSCEDHGPFRQFGGGYGKLVEPWVVPEKHLFQWVRPKVDLVELAKLRRNGRSITELSELLGVPRSTLCRKLKLL